MPQAQITILGAGAIGMAMATVLSENKYKVVFWDIEEDVVNGINLMHKNPRSMPNVKLDKSVKANADIQKAAMTADIAVFAVPSNVVREVSGKIAGFIPRNCVVVSLAKGLEKETNKTMEQVIGEELGGQFKNQITVISGPTLAHDIIEMKPSAAMLASRRSNTYSKRVKDAFENDWFHLSETRDVTGVCLSGVAKHTLSMSTGIMKGLEYSPDTVGWILTELFREMSRLIWKLGGQQETVYSLAGLGDVFGTSFSETSRNRQFGELLGKGKTVTRAVQSVGETVEGIGAIEALNSMAEKEKLQLPILRSLGSVVLDKKKCSKVFKELISEL